MQRQINNTNIQTFGYSVSFDIYAREMTFNTLLTTFNGSGQTNVLGIAFSVQDQSGVMLSEIDWNSPQIIPSITDEWVLDMSNVGYEYLFQTYKIIGAIQDQDGTVYTLEMPLKKVCSPANINESGYVDGLFDLKVNCSDNIISVKEVTNLSYSGKQYESIEKNGTLFYPTGTINQVDFTSTPFSNNQLFTGQYRINCTTIGTYNQDDDFFVKVTYLTNNPFDVTCNTALADLTCCIASLQDQYYKNCNTAIGQRAKQQLDAVTMPLLSGLLKEINGMDASEEAKIIKEQLRCNCGKSSLRQNELSPINPTIYSIVLVGVGGTVATPSVSGNTKTYQIKSNIYQVAKGDTGDLSYTITTDSTTANTVKYKFTFNKEVLAGNILTAIANNDELLTQFNALINSANAQIDLSNLNGRCVIDLSSIDYFLSFKVASASNTVKNILIGANTYSPIPSIAVSNVSALELWLNGLGLGSFSVSFAPGTGGSYLNILSAGNPNNIVSLTLTVSANDIVVPFQKTNKSLIAVLQALIDYLCELTTLQIALGRTLNLCYFNVDGTIATQQYSSETIVGNFLGDLSTAICNITGRINSLLSITCSRIQQVFVDNSGAQFNVGIDRFYGTLLGACSSINASQAAQAILNAIINNSFLKTQFCAITCADPAPCPEISAINISYANAVVGLYQVAYSVPVTANQVLSIRYRLCNTETWTTVTVGLVTLPNGNISGQAPFTVIANPVQGACYEVWVQNNCGGNGFRGNISIPAQTPVITFVNNINTNVPTNCCPTGYTLTDDESSCFQVDEQPATYTGSTNPITAQHYSLNVYGTFGMAIYKLGGFNVNGTWPTGDPSLFPTIYTTRSAGDFPNATVVAYATGVWINNTSCSLQTGACGRLNQTGIWRTGLQTYTGTLGFSRQINIPTSGVYYIGVGGDDYNSIIINGVTILQQNVAAACAAAYLNSPGSDGLFKFWNIYPVFLNAGPNLLQMTTTNSGSQGVLGFEVYDATESELASVASVGDLAAMTVFSTKDVVNGESFEIGNYNCNDYPGYQLVNDGGVYYCRRVLTTNVIPCE